MGLGSIARRVSHRNNMCRYVSLEYSEAAGLLQLVGLLHLIYDLPGIHDSMSDCGDDCDHGLLAVRVTRLFWRPAYIRKQEKTEVQGRHHPTLRRFVPLRSVQTGILSPCPVVPTDSRRNHRPREFHQLRTAQPPLMKGWGHRSVAADGSATAAPLLKLRDLLPTRCVLVKRRCSAVSERRSRNGGAVANDA